MSGSDLKVIAIVAMLADHLGSIVFPQALWLRWIGRLTFPIMAFFIYEGWRHTRDLRRYAMRIAAFALASELPFDLSITGRLVNFEIRNIGFTLLLGLLAVECADRGGGWLLLSGALCLLGDLLRVDYGALGVLSVLMFYLFACLGLPPALSVAASTFFFTIDGWLRFFGNVYWGDPLYFIYRSIPPQSIAVFSIPLLMLYNGKRGNAPWWLFYAFYPAHLLFLYFFCGFIRGAVELII